MTDESTRPSAQRDRRPERIVGRRGNESVWPFLGDELPPANGGRPRDPYLEEGCHPDVVARLWHELNAALPLDCRGQAKGRPVLAHPGSDRILAFARGTQYALWLVEPDHRDAVAAGLSAVMRWSGRSVTDLTPAGRGWIWGGWRDDEAEWLRRSYAEAGR